MKTEELTGDWLDYWVARAEGHEVDPPLAPGAPWPDRETLGRKYEPNACRFSSDWQFGGPIMERDRITIEGRDRNGNPAGEWCARIKGPRVHFGATALQAAMRAFLAKKFGEEVPDTP